MSYNQNLNLDTTNMSINHENTYINQDIKKSETEKQNQQDHDEIVEYFADFVKNKIKKEVNDFRLKGLLFHPETNPKGKITEIEFNMTYFYKEALLKHLANKTITPKIDDETKIEM